LEQLGIEDPKAEISDNYNLGFMANFWNGSLLFTADFFQINISDRIVISERLSTSLFPAVADLFPEAKEIRFFTNHVNTATRGLETVLTYKKFLSVNHRLYLSGAFTYNQTEVVSQKDIPEEILAGSNAEDQDILLLGQTAIELIEVAQPRSKFIVNANYHYKKWGINTRITRFGNVKAYSSGLSEEDDNVECDDDGRCVQTFAAKTLTDLSISYDFSSSFTLTVGSNNVFDVYPDKYNNFRDGFVGEAGSYQNGQIPYSRNSNQFGFNGAYYYLMANLRF
jgi:iron complex outermembrane receptor protein